MNNTTSSKSNGMTKDQFFTIFGRHLRVAEPKRQELISEVETHFAEQGLELGQPKHMASDLNRVHVGYGSHEWAPFLLFIGWAILSLLLNRWLDTMGVSIYSLNGSGVHTALWSLNNVFAFLGPVGIAVFTGIRMSQIHRPWRYLRNTLLGVSLASCLIFLRGVSNDAGNDPTWVLLLGALLVTTFVTGAFTIGSMIAMILALPRQPLAPKRQGFGVIFELILALGLFVIGFFGIMFFSEAIFQPYDMWLPETRPQGSFVVAMNDFFETGYGTLLLFGVYTAWVIWRTSKSIRRIRSRTS